MAKDYYNNSMRDYIPTITENIIAIVFIIVVIACLSLRFTHDKEIKGIEIKCDSICNDTILI